MRPFYTLSELTPDTFADTEKLVLLAVIGNPIAHSRSPQMQQAALDAMGVPISYIRVLAETGKGDFERTARRLADQGFVGANVTVPFKKNAFAMAAEADALSRLCGASNTLKFSAEGWLAFNTDGPGFEQAIAELCGCPLSFQKTLILGACGGAGSALAAQCALSGCPQLTLANRPKPELARLAKKLKPHMPRGGNVRTVSMTDSEALAAAVAEADLIVNATSLGLQEGDPLPLDPEWLRPGQTVYDIVPHDTPLRRAATARGCLASDGLSMLLWQGAYAFSIWFGAMPPIAPMREALVAEEKAVTAPKTKPAATAAKTKAAAKTRAKKAKGKG